MTRPVVFRPQAFDELIEAHRWYESRRRGLGEEFVRACHDAVAVIAEHPESFRVVHGATRRVLLRRFPYSIFFVVKASELVILAVMHDRRDPRRWQRRR